MKAAVFATGLALLTLAGPAYASWAENANMRYPVYTGTDQALGRARADARRYGYYPRRINHRHKYYRR